MYGLADVTRFKRLDCTIVNAVSCWILPCRIISPASSKTNGKAHFTNGLYCAMPILLRNILFEHHVLACPLAQGPVGAPHYDAGAELGLARLLVRLDLMFGRMAALGHNAAVGRDRS